MKINVPLPFDWTEDPELLSMEGVTEVGAAIERAGFNAAMVTDHPCPTSRWLDGGGHEAHEPFVTLSMLAMATRKVRLQTGKFESAQSLVDRLGRYRDLGVSAAAIYVDGSTRREWCDNAERIGADVITKL